MPIFLRVVRSATCAAAPKTARERWRRRCSKQRAIWAARSLWRPGPRYPDDIRWPADVSRNEQVARQKNYRSAASNQAFGSRRKRSRNSCFLGANQPLIHGTEDEPAMTPDGLCELAAYAERPWERLGPRGRPSPARRKATEGSFCAKRVRTGGGCIFGVLGLSAAKSETKVDNQTYSLESRGKSLTLEELL
jgi:hypothetical protein